MLYCKKKSLKSNDQLGKQHHAPLLEAAFDLGREERVDVLEAYSAALLRLQRAGSDPYRLRQ